MSRGGHHAGHCDGSVGCSEERLTGTFDNIREPYLLITRGASFNSTALGGWASLQSLNPGTHVLLPAV